MLKRRISQYRQYWTEAIQNVVLPRDINSRDTQAILSDLDQMYSYIRIDYGILEGTKDKCENLIRQYERSKAEGRNEDDRKKNATEFLENFPVKESETMNMYEYYREVLYRYVIVESFVKTIDNKQQRLITISGVMKIDSQLGNGYHSPA